MGTGQWSSCECGSPGGWQRQRPGGGSGPAAAAEPRWAVADEGSAASYGPHTVAPHREARRKQSSKAARKHKQLSYLMACSPSKREMGLLRCRC